MKPGLIEPETEYRARLEQRIALAARERRYDSLFVGLRLALAISVPSYLVLAKHNALTNLLIGFAALLAFVLLALGHDIIIRRRQRAERAADHYRHCLDRLAENWQGKGSQGQRFADLGHAYADDLDLFGRGSLFELLSTARTGVGEETLARWLLAPSPIDELKQRQAGVAELAGQLDLAEDFAVLGRQVKQAADSKTIGQWGGLPADSVAPSTRVLAMLVAIAQTAAVTLMLMGVLAIGPAFMVLLLGVAFAGLHHRRTQTTLRQAAEPASELKLLAALLGRLERARFEAPRLTTLVHRLQSHGVPPSRCIAGLSRLVSALDSQRNPMFFPLAKLWLWETQLGFGIDAWRARFGGDLKLWLETIGELEALLSLATYHYERTDVTFAELVASDTPLFEAEGLGHPLIPQDKLETNDIRLGSERRLLIVTGSNMSGKSTFLRTVGSNAVLALAGAPTRARTMRLSPLAVGASIRINDSLQDGDSRFYAEIKRLRHIVDLASKGPALFLLDEILHGTNSHDRRVGAQAVVKGLMDKGAVGLVTTHDLALAEIATTRPDADNVHFEDQLADGKMRFDYRLKPGVVQKSNALELMRAVGLEV